MPTHTVIKGYPKVAFYVLLVVLLIIWATIHIHAFIISGSSDDPYAHSIMQFFWSALVPLPIALIGFVAIIWYGAKIHIYRKQGVEQGQLRWHLRMLGISFFALFSPVIFMLYAWSLPYPLAQKAALQRLTQEYTVSNFSDDASMCEVGSVQAYQNQGTFFQEGGAVIEVYVNHEGIKFMDYADRDVIEKIYMSHEDDCVNRHPREYDTFEYRQNFSIYSQGYRQFRG